MSTAPVGPRPGPRAWWWVLSLLPAMTVVACAWRKAAPIEVGDHAQYLSHARALAEGRPYADIGYLWSPCCATLGPPAFPPGLPLTLAPLVRFLGPDTALVPLFIAASFILWLLLAGRYFATLDPFLGLGVTLLAALPSDLGPHTTLPLSDFPFAAMCWAVISLYDHPGRWSRGRSLAVLGLAVAAIAYRPPGVALLPAMALFSALRARREGLGSLAPLVALLALGLLAAALLPLGRMVPAVPAARLSELAARALRNAAVYRFAWFESTLAPFPWAGPGRAWHLLAVPLAAAGLWRVLGRRPVRFAALFALCYGSTLLLAPVVTARYAWPLYPFVAFGLVAGAEAALARLWPAPRSGRGALLAASLLGLATVAVAARRPPELPALDHPDIQDLFARLPALVGGGAPRLAFFRPRVLTWETRLPAMCTFPGDGEKVRRELCRQGVTHVVVGSLGLRPAADRAFAGLVAAEPGWFTRVHRNRSFDVFRLDRAAACEESKAP